MNRHFPHPPRPRAMRDPARTGQSRAWGHPVAP